MTLYGIKDVQVKSNAHTYMCKLPPHTCPRSTHLPSGDSASALHEGDEDGEEDEDEDEDGGWETASDDYIEAIAAAGGQEVRNASTSDSAECSSSRITASRSRESLECHDGSISSGGGVAAALLSKLALSSREAPLTNMKSLDVQGGVYEEEGAEAAADDEEECEVWEEWDVRKSLFDNHNSSTFEVSVCCGGVGRGGLRRTTER
jgi:hypothetical protein